MNNDTVSGKFDQVAGKIKQGVGEAVGNDRLANQGAADQVKGAAKETWGNVKDTASDIGDSARAHTGSNAETSAHDTRNSITRGAENMKDSINAKLDNTRSDR